MEQQIKGTIDSCYTHVRNAYNKLQQLGATMPEHKNIENLRATILTLDLDIPKYTVSFDPGDGTPKPNDQEIYSGFTATEPTAPVKEGCVFTGWYKKIVEDWGTIYTTEYPEGIKLTSQQEYAELGSVFPPYGDYTVGGNSIPRSTITGFKFGEKCTYVPNYFLDSCNNLTTLTRMDIPTTIGMYAFGATAIEVIDFPNVTEIGNFFFTNTDHNPTIILGDNLTTIGTDFMLDASGYNRDLTIPSSVTSIGNNFMSQLNVYTATIYVETTAIPGGEQTLTTDDEEKPAYATGITIKGSHAEDWLDALPDSNDLPYRKLLPRNIWGILYTTEYPDGYYLKDKADYDGLQGFNSSTYTLPTSGLTINVGTIRKFSFGTNCTYTPDGFLSQCAVEKIEHFERVNTIGSDFLVACTRFNQPLTFGSNITSIGISLMNWCNSFIGPITVETDAVSSDGMYASLAALSPTYPMYETGIILKGSKASAWKAALPDMARPYSSSPSYTAAYRKLILG